MPNSKIAPITHTINISRNQKSCLSIILRIIIFLCLQKSANKRISMPITINQKFFASKPQLYMEPSKRTHGFLISSIDFIMPNASLNLTALKKIHEKSISINVPATCINLCPNESLFKCSNATILFLNGWSISPMIWYKPFIPPHATKENCAPCHKLLMRK